MNNKTIFITGGNAGIGLATALLFANEGANVAILSRRREENAAAREKIEKLGVKALDFAGDVTDEATIRNALAKTAETFGGLHFAFNNAGVEQVPTPLVEQTLEDYRRIIDVNVMGVWLCLKHELPLIEKSGGGCAVNNSSVAGLVGMAQIELYIASKHAVLGLTKSAALEYAKSGVRVNAVCPGAVHTEMYERFVSKDPDLVQTLENMHPMGRSGTPEEIASAVLWLCRDATFTTGQALALDGGFTVP
jgi:NAD(P)-dependent dehydrogenase (short-subunit alcohol dehydrogenase family)